MKQRFFVLITLFLLLFSISNAQNIGINTTTPDPSAALDVVSSDKGILIPRTDTIAVNAAGTPATGLMIYQTTDDKFYYHNGDKWLLMTTADDAVFERNGSTIRQKKNYSDSFIMGRDSLPKNGELVTGSLLFYNKSKNSFRVGTSYNRPYFSPDSLGWHSAAFGSNTKAKGSQSMVWGTLTEALKGNATAWGYYTKAKEENSTAWGEYSVSSGENATAWGHQSRSLNTNSTAWGSFTMASGINSTTWGESTEATASYSTAWGYQSKATGSRSTSWGHYTTAAGSYSTAFGVSTTAPSFDETVLGRFNTNYTPNSPILWNLYDRLFVVGNGLSDASRHNALTILKNGNSIFGADINMESGHLDITDNSTESIGHINLIETVSNDGARILFKNGVETNNKWTLWGKADNTLADSYYNVHYTTTGNILTVRGNGKVGINRSNPSTNALEVNGNASKSTSGSWLANSDRRLKKNINTINQKEALNKLLSLRGVTYEWNDNKTGNTRPAGLQYGFIAQELMEVFPRKVSKDNLGFYQTAYGDYDPLFVQAIKELSDKIISLEAEKSEREERIKTLEDRLQKIENFIESK